MLFKLTSDTQQRGKQLCVNIHLPRVLGSVALSVCTIQDTPLFLCHTHRVLEALKDKVTVLGAIAMPALCSQLLVLCILQTHATGTHQAVELCAFGRFDLQLADLHQVIELLNRHWSPVSVWWVPRGPCSQKSPASRAAS